VYRNPWTDDQQRKVRGGMVGMRRAYDGCVINYEPEARASLSDPIRRALSHSGVIDITTTGRRSGRPRRIEIVYHVFGGRMYISGMPNAQRRRRWLLNLEKDPHLTVHLKHGIKADLPATARVIDDPAERREIMRQIIDTAWSRLNLDTMVAYSPLIEVNVEGLAA
jgi:deazaflavin-dependent oxidoreductase (nitroreductase family)